MNTRIFSPSGSIHHENLHIIHKKDYAYQTQHVQPNHLVHSFHSSKRADQRGVSDEVLRLVISYGKVIRKQGLEFYLGTTKNFPGNIDHRLLEKSSDVVVVVSGSEILTCYRNSKAIKRIKKKSDRLAKR